jgi:hypothetical protein
MPPVTETEMKELRDLVLGLREEIRLGFSETKLGFTESKADTDAKFAEAKADTDAKFAEVSTKFAESKANTNAKFAEAKADTNAKFAEVNVKFAEAKANTNAQFAEVNVAIANLSGDVRVLEERTKLGFWGFIGRALIISTFALAISFATKYFFFSNVKI